jgi:hypothetical protein
MLHVALVVVLSLGAVLAGGLILGAIRWNSETRELRTRLESARVAVGPRSVAFQELEGLPTPVQRYFRATLTEGQPMVVGLRVRHRGTFNMGEATDRWRPFTSDQRIVARRPGFDWNGRIAMLPGLPVLVHDAYAGGEGRLHAALLGLLSLANMRDTGDMAESELMRFVAETPWYPTVLLPSQGVRWEHADDQSARATLIDGSVAATMLFTFNESGLIETVRSTSRGRMVNGEIVPTPWQGRFWNYEERSGMRIPLDGEVAWLLPEGPKPYWRGRIAEIVYEFAR